MTYAIASMISKKVEAFKQIDMGQDGSCLGKFLRISVEIDIAKPLERGMNVAIEGGDTFFG